MKVPVYVGLDTAAVTGIAVWIPELQKAYISQVEGSPIEQGMVVFAKGLNLGYQVTYVLEKIHTFRNANTTRSLLERYGYIRFTLLAGGYRVEEVSPRIARHYLGVDGKQAVFDFFRPHYTGLRLTSHMTDAVAVAVYQAHLDGYELRTTELLLTEDRRSWTKSRT